MEVGGPGHRLQHDARGGGLLIEVASHLLCEGLGGAMETGTPQESLAPSFPSAGGTDRAVYGTRVGQLGRLELGMGVPGVLGLMGFETKGGP